MPAVVMENGSRDGLHTNHDRDPVANGANGFGHASERSFEKNKSRSEPQQSGGQVNAVNGVNGLPESGVEHKVNIQPVPQDVMAQISQLPPEIVHITEGFEPLSGLLTRLAQVTHTRLSNKILELASMNPPGSVVNGNGTHFGTASDDNSVENIKKKVQLLRFAEETHANWTKALVITHWSRISEDVSKVIDLKVHLDGQRWFYDSAVHEMSEVKRSLIHARVPNPDLKTAVEVLSTGKASWMPDLGYLETPPLSPRELLKSFENLNTLLAIRLNIHDYDKIPYHFQDYTIHSGRVTFKVPGEFEVDLTIADENFNTQFWFIDFRFSFSPSPAQLPEHLRYVIEDRVNTALEKEGLSGCYKFLHEFVLTHKISELRRQAAELSRGRWIETLQVEPLHRALSIQYWVERYGKDGPRSWIIIGVHSGRRKDGTRDAEDTSHITMRWFRDSKEIHDVDIQLDLERISAESLLENVISRHVLHIMSGVYNKLSAKPLFASNDLAISLQRSKDPELTVQLTNSDSVKLYIEPVSGRFAISPVSRLSSQAEWKLNTQTRDPASNAHEFIENLRCVSISEFIISRALTVGWLPVRNPGLKQDEIKAVVPKDTLHLSWFRRAGWSEEWVVALSSGMSGERWWLIEINTSAGPHLKSHILVPLTSTMTSPTYTFLTGLHLFTSGLISHYVSQRALHARRAQYLVQESRTKLLPSPISLPYIFIKLSSILASRNLSRRSGKAWAKDILKITFQGIQTSSSISDATSTETPEAPGEGATGTGKVNESNDNVIEEKAVMIAEANMAIPMPSSVLVSQRIDKDIAFHPSSGAFAFRLCNKIGESPITSLTERLQRVEQFVDFVQVVKNHGKTLQCETVSLGKVVFTYNFPSSNSTSMDSSNITPTNGPVTTYRATVDFSGIVTPLVLTLEAGNPHVRILDHLTKVLNSPLGLNGVATLLPLTLPLLRGLDAIEESWLRNFDKCEVSVFARAIDWYSIRYAQPSLDFDSRPRRITFDIRLQQRNGVPWWCIRRERERGAPDADEIDTALKPLWDGNGVGMSWRGMQNAAIAKMEGTEALLTRVDSCMKEMVQSGVFAVQPIKASTTTTMIGQGSSLQESQGGLGSQKFGGGGQGQPQPTEGHAGGGGHEMIVID